MNRETKLPPDLKVLLEINMAIAMVRERKELFAAIIAQIRPLIPVDDTGLLVLDKTGKLWQDWSSVDNYQNTEAATQLQQMGYDGWLPVDRCMEYTLHHSGIITVARFMERYPEHPFGPVMWEAGLREMIFTPLLHRGKTLGVLFFDSQQEGTYTQTHLPLFKTIAGLVATAVANILANEEILEREREKSVLLSISKDIASVRGKEDLLHLVLEKIKPLFGFYDCGILVIDKQNRFRDLAVVHTEIDPSQGNFALRELGFYEQGQGLPYPDSALEWTIHQIEEKGHPVVFNYSADNSRFSDGALLEQLRQLGYREGLAGQLRIGGRCYGAFFINFRQEGQAGRVPLPLFQNVTDQLSIAVANILANEEILRQKAEIEGLKNKLEQENLYLQEEVGSQHNLGEIIGSSQPMQAVFTEVRQVAATDTTVLILGETGTGKELIARALHRLSPRKARPLVKINCAALPAQLIESELFGHERGAFTGAMERRIGKFEVASGSTLFLDEIGELPLELQSKLLRAIQEKEIERLGSNKTIRCDVRIVAATNRDLGKEVREGRFRAELYYRLSVFPLTLPPLRERKEDIPLLAMHFVEKYAHKLGRKITGIATVALKDMLAYHWPGNVREMEHVVERATLRATGATLKEMNLVKQKPAGADLFNNTLRETPVLKTLDEVEREAILLALQHCKGRIRGKGGAAEALGVIPNTLDYRMKRLGIFKQHLVRATEM